MGDDGKPKTAYANAKATMTPESFASIEATIAAHEGDAAWAKTAKVNVLLGAGQQAAHAAGHAVQRAGTPL